MLTTTPRIFGALAGIVLASVMVSQLLANPDDAQPSRLFELRTYTTHEGKLADLHARFRDHTNKLFVKHGMELVGYWTPTEGETAGNTLIYLLAYPDRKARDASWKAFVDDPVWKQAYAASREAGPIVAQVESTYLVPTDYSPLK